MTTKELLAQFNIVARTEFNRSYQEFEPQFGELLHEFDSPPVETNNFPFFGFLKGVEEFTGSRQHEIFPDGYNFTIVNKEWDLSVDIKRKDFERAVLMNSPLKGLNPYRQRISEMPMAFKDHPIELAFDMFEAGDASTYGLTFDGQNFFDTTHNYGTTAGSQSNIITNGAGITVANLHADIIRAKSRLNSFYYMQGGADETSNKKKRKLNKTMNRILIVAPDELYGALEDLRDKDRLATGESNTLKGKFDFVTRPFTDTNDYYVVVLDDRFFRPFLYQVEKRPEMDFPTLQDESSRERKVFTWGGYGRYNVAYGAWWTVVMVQNS